MSDSWLYCCRCHGQYPVGPVFFGCPRCSAEGCRVPLEMQYAVSTVEPDMDQPGIWRWSSLLPRIAPANRVTLDEGNTSLLPVASPHGPALFLKNETRNPTWSWKDRPNSVSVSMAKQFGYAQVAAISTGNHGSAVAAYAGAGGLQSRIFCHPDAPVLQLALMAGYGAKVTRGGRQEAMLRELVEHRRYFPCTILCPRAGFSNPFGVEGFKTIAFEIHAQLGGRVPDRVFVPVGSGDGIYGIWKGFRELQERGAIARAPRMIACQAAGAASAFHAFVAGSRRIQAVDAVDTIALSVGEPITGDHALRAVYESGGAVMTSADQNTLAAGRQLQAQGLALEPASALAYACAQQALVEEPTGSLWVIIGSGSAVKWPENLLHHYTPPPPQEETFTSIDALRCLERPQQGDLHARKTM